MGHEELVAPVEEYYDVDPHGVAECLQWVAKKSPVAGYEAFGRLIESEVEPLMRENLIQRAGLFGLPEAEEMLSEVYDQGAGAVDRKAALGALAKIPSESARARLQAVINGEREEAVYDLAGDAPTDKRLRDLRAHAVIGTLMNGKESDVQALFDRSFDGEAGDAIADYTEHFFAVVPGDKFVGPVVSRMLNRGKVSERLLLYVEARATSDSYGEVGRLLMLAEDPLHRQRIERVLAKIR